MMCDLVLGGGLRATPEIAAKRRLAVVVMARVNKRKVRR